MFSPPNVSAFGFSGPDWIGYNIMRKDAQSDWQKGIDFTRSERMAQEAFQERMSNTAWQRGTADMKAAGINPMLAFSQGGASTPSGGQGPISQIKPVAPPAAGTNAQMQTQAQTALLHAQEELTKAEANEVRARTPTHTVKIDEMKARIEDLRASVSERTASAARQNQQIENLRAEIPRIQEDVNRIMQEANRLASQTFLQGAQEREINQRVKANLPELEKQTRLLELYLTRVAIPGKELDAEVRQSFIGILGNYLKALIPFEGIIGAIPLGRGTKGNTQQPPIHKGSGDRPTIHRR